MHAETAVLQSVAALRADWFTPVMRVFGALGTAWSVTILGWGLVAALIVFKRWRHLATFLVYLSLLGVLGTAVNFVTKRPRPYGVTIIGDWIGFSMPSFPVAILAGCLMGIAYSLVVPGRPREWAKLGIGVVLAVVAFARLYLGVDHPSDVVWAVVLGVAIPLAAFRWFTPNEAFPVTYRRGKTAHLDVTGARGEAIRQAIARPARAHGPRGQAHRAGGVRWLHPAAAADRRRPRHLRLRQALREEPRARRPLVQARPDDPLRGAGGRDLVPERPPVRAVRGLHAAAHAGREAPGARAVRHRRDHPRTRVPDRHGVLRRRRRDQRGGRRRRGHRRGPAADPEAVGRRAGPPGHQAGQPDGPRRQSRCWSTRSSSRSGPRRGGRPSTWAT